MNKPKLLIILRIFVSLFLLALLLWLARENFAKICRLLSSLNLPIFMLAFLIYISSTFLMSWRLKIVLAVQDVFFAIKDLFPLTLIGLFFTNFMPTSVGGDLIKGYYISKKSGGRLSAYTSVFIDRLIGMFSIALIAGVALVLVRKNIEHKFIIWTIVLLLLCCVAFALSIFYKKPLKRIAEVTGVMRLLQILRLEAPIKKTYAVLNIYANHKTLIAKTIILSAVVQFIGFFSIFLLSRSLLVFVPFGKILLVMPVIFILCMLPVTMNGLGLREWGFVFFFSASIGNVAALSLSLLYLAMFLLTSLIGGIIYLFWR